VPGKSEKFESLKEDGDNEDEDISEELESSEPENKSTQPT